MVRFHKGANKGAWNDGESIGQRWPPEGHEEGVALGVDLDPAVAGEGPAQGAAVGGQRLGIGLRAQLVERSFVEPPTSVKEGDRAEGQVRAAHSVGSPECQRAGLGVAQRRDRGKEP